LSNKASSRWTADRQAAADLANAQVLEGFDASGEPKPAPGIEADHAASPHDPYRRLLLDVVERRHGKYQGEDRNPNIFSCLNSALKGRSCPDPGTRWEYGITSISSARRWKARAASGSMLNLRDHMFAPLG